MKRPSDRHTPSIEKDFKTFNPHKYLEEYYNQLGDENKELIKFYIKAYSRVFNNIKKATVLEFGGGPTIYQLITLVKYDVSIDFSDYLDQNLMEIKKWINNRQGKFSWNPFIKYALKKENKNYTLNSIKTRAFLMRSKIKRLLHCDVRMPNPLGSTIKSKRYDIVNVSFVPESITNNSKEWNLSIDHISSLVRSKGYLVMCAILGAKFYRVGSFYFPATPISQDMIKEALRRNKFKILFTHFVDAEHKEAQGYQSIFMLLSERI